MTSRAPAIRRVAVVLHRWTGLALAAFLIVVAATGAVLAFQMDLQRLIAPERFVTAYPTRPVDWLALRDAAEQLSGGDVDTMPLYLEHGAVPVFNPAPRPGQAALGFDELLLDPFTGREITRARSANLRDGPAQLIPFIYSLHETLLLGGAGRVLVGSVALAWTLDCFVGFYLTLPATWSRPEWWRRWRAAWTLRWPPASRFRFHFDLHRAGGLWFWVMMLVFAWSGTGFNLPAVYRPVMHALTGYLAPEEAPPSESQQRPVLDWAQGLAAARARAQEAAAADGFRIVRERELRYLRQVNRYALGLRTSRDRSDQDANTWVTLDADTGALIAVDLPTGARVGNTIDTWIGLIHEAAVGGFAVRVLVSLSGLAVVAITISGLLVWMRKRQGRIGRSPHSRAVAGPRHDFE